MSTGITAFTYGTRRVRTVIGADGEPRFIAADVAAVLGYRMASDMTRRLDDDEKGYAQVRTPGGEQTMSVITESGLYQAVFASKAKGARRFRRWVTGEVLPAIRRHGGYLAPDAAERALTDPDFIIRLATRLKEERAARTALAAEHAALEARVEADAPHTALGRAVADADGLVLVKAVADVLTQEGLACSQQRLFAWLRAHGWLCAGGGEMWNRPTKWALEKGYVRAVERVISTHGGRRQRWTSKLTGLGQEVLVEGFTTGRYTLGEDP